MKRIIFTIYISLTCYYNYSQTWAWGRGGNGTTPITIGSECQALCTDPSGNVFIGGHHYGPGSNFAQLSFGTVSLTPVINTALFLAKYDKNGNFLWARNSSENTNAYGRSIASDPAGNVYLTGDYGGPSMVFGTSTITPGGIYLTKYDPNGNVLWAKSFLGGSAWSVACDQIGNSYLTGWFGTGTAVFGSYTLTNTGPENIFVIKFDSNGNVIWARKDGGDGFDEPYSIAVDNSGNVVIGGFASFSGTYFSVGSFTFTNPNINTDDAFVAKYDNLGNVLWARVISGVGWEEIRSVTTDPSGNVFATGFFSTASLVIGTYTLSNPTGTDKMFVVKYDSNGNVMWINYETTTAKTCGSSIKSDPYGNTWVSGDFASGTGTIVIGTTSITPNPTASIPAFLVEFDPSGNVICSSTLDQGGNFRNSVAVDTLDIYVASHFSVPTWNPNFVIGTSTLSPNPGNIVPFVAKFNCSASTGIQDINSEKFSSLIYPNPNNGLFKLNVETEIEDGEMILYNVMGQKVYSQKVSTGENNITTKDLYKGIYFYDILNKNRKLSQGKLIIN